MKKNALNALENPFEGVSKSILAKNPVRVVVGKRGFIPSENPKERVLNVRVTSETKEFIESWCTLWGITQSELILRSIECYTGFDGKNGHELINNHEDILPM
jgi:hypothetical protein